MISDKLNILFEFDKIEVFKENEDFGFWIKAGLSKRAGFYILFTEGLSTNLQKVDEKNEKLERIELYFLLPDYWDFSKKPWPIEWLNKIAQIPQKNKTWFGIGDTISANTGASGVDEQLACNHFILSESLLTDSKLSGSEWEKESIKLLAVIPIFQKEFDFKNQNSATVLFSIFRKNKVSEMIDIYRTPKARKKIMGLF